MTTIMQNDFISTKVRESLLNFNMAAANNNSNKETIAAKGSTTDSFQVTALGTLALASPKRHEFVTLPQPLQPTHQ